MKSHEKCLDCVEEPFPCAKCFNRLLADNQRLKYEIDLITERRNEYIKRCIVLEAEVVELRKVLRHG